MTTHLELVARTSSHAVAIPFTTVLTVGSGMEADIVLAGLEPIHAVIESTDGDRALVKSASGEASIMNADGRCASTVLLTLNGPAVLLGSATLRLVAGTPRVSVSGSRRSAALADSQQLSAIDALGESATRLLFAFHALGSIHKRGTTPIELHGSAAHVFREHLGAGSASVLWGPDAREWTRATVGTTAPPDRPVELDRAAMQRVVDSSRAFVSRAHDRAVAYLPLRGPGADRVSGVVFVERAQGAAAFSAVDVEIGTLMGRHLVVLLERAHAVRQLHLQSRVLETAHARLSTIMDAISEGVVLIRRQDGDIELVNELARSLFDQTRPKNQSTVLRTFSIAELVESAFAGRHAARRDVVGKDGRVFEASASPVVSAHDALPDAVVVLRDVTDERRRERAFRESERLRVLGEALATVAHELNNPLTAVIGFSALLSDRAPEALQAYADKISSQAERCLTIVRDVLAASRARPTEPPTTFDALELVCRSLEPLEADLEHSKIAVSVEGTPLYVQAHFLRLQQVLVNLVRNASEALVESRSTDPRIRIVVGERNGRAEIAVEDNGPGISPELRQRLLKPFATTRAHGTGLGLSTAAAIVREYGGELSWESVPGRTRFQLSLPLGDARTNAHRPRSTTMVRPRIVFAAEDEEPIRMLLREYLEAEGHVLELVEDGAAALERLLESPSFDVVLLDLRMPGVSGIEILERLEAAGSTLLPRCYIMTGEVDDLLLRSATELAAGVLKKPFTLVELRRVLARALSPLSTDA